MAIEEKFGEMSPQELANLLANATRLASSGAPKQQAEAERLLPLINAELAARKARAPARAKAVRKTLKKA